jgi:hypothetical protein
MEGMQLAIWLANLAQFANRHFYFLAAGLISATVILLASDYWQHWIAAILSVAGIEKLGREIGETAFNLGFVATLYYGVRDIFVIARRMKLRIPVWLDSLVKYWITVLRLGHPFLGSLVFSVVLVHGYVMWRIWDGGNFNFAIETGLTAASILLLVAVTGLCIRWMPKMLKLRFVHRLVGILFVLFFVLHRMVN